MAQMCSLSPAMITLERIERIFQVGGQQVHALREINVQVSHGEYLAIMGPSGSGKSTLLNILGLLDRPDSGLYHFADRDMMGLNDNEQAQVRRSDIGFVFQSYHLIPRLTAFENVELPMMLAEVDPGERRERVDEALASLGLESRRAHRPGQLSGGQRQRVAIARAIVMRPQLLLADEPTGNLDRSAGEEVMQILEQLHHQGLCIIIVTHDPQVGARTQRIIRMDDGNIVTDTVNEPSAVDTDA